MAGGGLLCFLLFKGKEGENTWLKGLKKIILNNLSFIPKKDGLEAKQRRSAKPFPMLVSNYINNT